MQKISSQSPSLWHVLQSRDASVARHSPSSITIKQEHWATINSSRTLLQPSISHECWQARKASQLRALWFTQAPSCGTVFQRLAYLQAERMHLSLFSPVTYRGPEMIKNRGDTQNCYPPESLHQKPPCLISAHIHFNMVHNHQLKDCGLSKEQ